MLDQAHDLRRLAKPGGTAEAAVGDLAAASDQTAGRACRTADAVLLATTSDPAAVLGTFAAIKALAGLAKNSDEGAAVLPAFSLYVAVDDPTAAEAIYRRLARACRRLLGIEIGWAGCGSLLHPAAIGQLLTRRAERD
jgi:hypothetical protein